MGPSGRIPVDENADAHGGPPTVSPKAPCGDAETA